MTNTVYSTNQITSASYVLFMSPGDSLFVKSGILVASTAASGEAIASNSGTNVYIDGELYASTGLSDIAGTLYVGASGSIIGTQNAVTLLGSINLDNLGTISGSQGAIAFEVAAAGYIYNIYNAGLIDGGTGASFSDPQGSANVTNTGIMKGDVVLPSGINTFDSTLGQVFGTIHTGGGGTIIAGTNGGSVVGGTANDVLYVNPTQTAANNASQFVLDGGTGNNWLYGGGAFTTFDSGDNAAGTVNQIFGGRSEMANVTGYTNNTVSYAGLANDGAKSVYVDLINGDTYKSTAANASGAPTSSFIFEDYLQNVPNVIGSNGGDVIFADNAIDQITGGKGADTLYAGTGSGSQDTFKYGDFSDSLYSGFDYLSGFKVGTDKIDLSALNLPKADITLSYGGSGYNSIYVEHNPSQGFNTATDMFIYVKASTNTALSFHDIIG